MNVNTAQAKTKQAAEGEQRRALVTHSSALAAYRTPEELEEMMLRFRALVPGGQQMDDVGLKALAQFSLLYGLSPFNRECGYFNDAPQALIRGFRKKGREFLAERQSHEDLRYEVITSPQERLDLAISDRALAVRCIGTVAHKRQAHQALAEKWRAILGNAAPYEAVLAQIGPPPVSIGYGIMERVEIDRLESPSWVHKCRVDAKNLDDIPKKGGRETWRGRRLWGFAPCPDCPEDSRAAPLMFPHIQRVEKRAEAHWWKLETDLAFDLGEGVELGEVVDAPWREVEAGGDWPEGLSGEEVERLHALREESERRKAEDSQLTPEEIKARGAAVAKTLYSDPGESAAAAAPPAENDEAQAGEEVVGWPPDLMLLRKKPGSWPPEIRRALMRSKLAKSDYEAAGMLAYSGFDETVTEALALAYGEVYRHKRDGGASAPHAGYLASVELATGG